MPSKNKIRKILGVLEPSLRADLLTDQLKEDISKNLNEIIQNFNSKISQLRSNFLSELDSRLKQVPDLSKEFSSLKSEFEVRLKELEKEEIPNIQIQMQDLVSDKIDTKEDLKQELEDKIGEVRREFIWRLGNLGGGNANRQINVSSSVMSNRYTDINFIPGSTLGITTANDDVNKRVNITISAIPSSVASAVVAGNNTEIQYNNNGTFGASSTLTWNRDTSVLSARNVAIGTTTATGKLTVQNAASGANAYSEYIIAPTGTASVASYGLYVEDHPLSVAPTNFNIWSGPPHSSYISKFQTEWPLAVLGKNFFGSIDETAQLAQTGFFYSQDSTGFGANAFTAIGYGLNGTDAYAANFYASVVPSVTQTAVTANAFYATCENLGGGVLTDAKGIWLTDANNTGGGTITNNYGLFVADETAGTNNYAISTNQTAGDNSYAIHNAGTAKSYFNGNVGIGTAIPSSVFSVAEKSVINSNGLLTKYNNVATAGWGVPAVYASGRASVQTARSAALATYTIGAADGSFEVSGNVNVTASTTHSFSLDVTYTDETSTARTLILPMVQLGGAFVAGGLITNVTGAGPYESPTMHIRVASVTAITVRPSAGTYTSVTYNAEGTIKQIS